MNYVLENSYPFSFSRQFLNLEVIERFQHEIQQLYFFGFKAPYTFFQRFKFSPLTNEEKRWSFSLSLKGAFF